MSSVAKSLGGWESSKKPSADLSSSSCDRINNLRRNIVVKGRESTIILFLDILSNTAFFKIRFFVDPYSIFLFIPPEHIMSITRVDQVGTDGVLHCSSPNQKMSRHSPLTCLQFCLSKPVLLVGPVGHFLPLGNAQTQALASLEELAVKTTLTISIPPQAFSDEHFQAICSVSASTWRSYPDHSTLDNLYCGQGGQIITITPSPEVHNETGSSPPSYNKLDELDELSFPTSPRPNKRRRVDPEPSSDLARIQEFVQSVCQGMISQQQSKLRKDLLAELIKMEERITDAASQTLSKQIQDLKSEIVTEYQAQLETLQTEVVAEVTPQVMSGIWDEFDARIDDQVCGIKIELEDFVKDEMRAVQDSVLDAVPEVLSDGIWHFTPSDL
ncbi:hypothetical protein M406DRAFT_102709 [Cryphonectria parasitica EP155]|uniref:Uncharacterized protein n=1 Tax=Cryphonectria parasitica (strain ATCC 38755 / EP155) TaxID=660469 RepID=A0A9P5CSA0_CRYP1|nr:uncharacterized protein M406DRAFT_102709 [Cryphonectria parasitica EP155]KAF3769399.1 hypothetical protein M406DRAFT_102709 [Cryphonectria parasitica EP155]